MRNYGTGSRRDSREGKGRYDLISPHATKRLAQRLEFGVEKYGERNWEKGQPMEDFFDSAKRHLDMWQMGNTDEDHLAAAMWNVHCMIHFDTIGYPDVEMYPDDTLYDMVCVECKSYQSMLNSDMVCVTCQAAKIMYHRIDMIPCSTCGKLVDLVNSGYMCSECVGSPESHSKRSEVGSKVIPHFNPEDALGGRTELGVTYTPPEVYESGVIRPGREDMYKVHTDTQFEEMDRREAYRNAYKKSPLDPDVARERETLRQLSLFD